MKTDCPNNNPELLEECIDQYLLNRMSPEEKADFEKSMSADPALKQQVRIQQQLIKHLRANENASLKKWLQNTVQSSQSPITIQKRAWKWVLPIAALLVLALMVTFLLPHFTQEKNTEQSFTQLAPVPQNYLSLDLRGIDSHSLFNMGMKFYEKGNYDEAMVCFNKMDDWEAVDANGIFYIGLTAMLVKDFQKAIQAFDSVRGQDFYFREYLPIYDGIMQMELGNYAEAEESLQQVSDGNGKFAPLAKELLSKLPPKE